jgi:hypothetical protein
MAMAQPPEVETCAPRRGGELEGIEKQFCPLINRKSKPNLGRRTFKTSKSAGNQPKRVKTPLFLLLWRGRRFFISKP